MVAALRPSSPVRVEADPRRDLPEYRHTCDRLLFKGVMPPGSQIETYCDRCRTLVRITVNCDPTLPVVVMRNVR